MKRFLALAILFIATSSFVVAQTQKHPVEDFFMSGIAAFNAHHLDGFMKQFADDVEMYEVVQFNKTRPSR